MEFLYIVHCALLIVTVGTEGLGICPICPTLSLYLYSSSFIGPTACDPQGSFWHSITLTQTIQKKIWPSIDVHFEELEQYESQERCSKSKKTIFRNRDQLVGFHRWLRDKWQWLLISNRISLLETYLLMILLNWFRKNWLISMESFWYPLFYRWFGSSSKSVGKNGNNGNVIQFCSLEWCDFSRDFFLISNCWSGISSRSSNIGLAE